MFNKTYHARAVRQAGGGHKATIKALLRLPAPWRPLVTIAAAADAAFHRPANRIAPGVPRKAKQKTPPGQLEFAFTDPPDEARPLFDIFPEAYE
jgi:hypothetical protein